MDHPEGDPDDDTGLSNHDQDADIVMGHEYCAEIVEYGPATERRWPLGTRVSSLPVLLGDDGPRVIGQAPEAPGGFGELFLMSEAVTQVVPGELPSELVAVADAISVGWSYAKRAAVTPEEVPLVVGCGAIGLAVIASLTRLGVGPIVAADFVASRRDAAIGHGSRRGDRPRGGLALHGMAGGRLRLARRGARHHGAARSARVRGVRVRRGAGGARRHREGLRTQHPDLLGRRSAGGRAPPHHDGQAQGPEHAVRGWPEHHPLERGVRRGLLGPPRRHPDDRADRRPRRTCPPPSTTPVDADGPARIIVVPR